MNSHRYKIFLFVSIFFLLSFSSSNAQYYGSRFKIAPNYYVTDFSIDRIAQQIYFDYFGAWKIKVDLKTGTIDTTWHGGTATFGNNQHLMFDLDTLYNLDEDSYYALIPPDTIRNSYWNFEHPYFSPNDSNLMFSILYPEPYPTSYITNNFIFSLKDSSFSPVDTNVWPKSSYLGYGNSPQWSSDSSFIYFAGDSAIAEYFIRSKRIDTLVSLHNYSKIVSFAYNTKENILSYSASIWVNPNFIQRIYFHYKDSTSDYLAFSQERDDSSCNYFGGILTFLRWSPNNDRLGFLLFDPINRITMVYFYSINSNRSYELITCNDRGLKYFLQWANEDTIVYLNTSEGHLYGINVYNVDEIRGNKDNNLPSDFGLSSYPNPFNSSATLEIKLPRGKNAFLSIYNIQGKLIKEYRIRNDGRTKYRIIWTAVNGKGESVASGVYIAVLNSENPKDHFIKTSKIIYLK